MSCNPLRWLFGLLPLVLIGWTSHLGILPRVEDDLTQRTREHLDRNGLQWANVAFKGRDAILTGRAEEESDQRRPGIETAKVWGVRTVEDRIEVLQLIKNYVWSATVRGNDLVLDGHIPNEAARKAILASAKSSLPKLTVRDSLDLARGAPDQKIFIAGTAFALRQLAGLNPGARATLEGAALTVEGEGQTSRSYETVRTALAGTMPAGVSLKQDRVIPPRVSPYTWSASLKGRQVEMTGHVPSIAARNDLRTAVERTFPGANVNDRTQLASGAPSDWLKTMTGTLGRLGQLKQGSIEATDAQVNVTGLTETEPAAQAVRTALRSALPSPYRLTERIEQDPVAKAAEEARKAQEEAAKRAAEMAAAEAAARRAADEQRAREIAAADAEARRRATETEAQRQRQAAEEEARRKAEAEAQRQRQAQEETARRKAEEAAKRSADDAARRVKTEADAKRRADEARVVEGQRCQREMSSVAEKGVILFQRASADLDRRSHETLNALARIIKSCPGFAVEVGGHTDNEGTPERNQRLSDRRANSVMEYLGSAGVPAATLTAVGYGDAKPKVPNDTRENMAKNRRIEFSVKSK